MPELVPQLHHREGIQNALDEAHDEAIRDNEAFDEANIGTEGETHISNEEIQSHLSEKEKAMVEGVEKEMSPELAEIIARLKEVDYLDTSLEGKEAHPLVVYQMDEDGALDSYRRSSNDAWVLGELELRGNYNTPQEENLDVIIMKFNKDIQINEAIDEMDKLGVRPLTYEELVQYGTEYPSQQEEHPLVALGGRVGWGGRLHVPTLTVEPVGRALTTTPVASEYAGVFNEQFRFLVVRK